MGDVHCLLGSRSEGTDSRVVLQPCLLKNTNKFNLGVSHEGDLLGDERCRPGPGSLEKFVEVTRNAMGHSGIGHFGRNARFVNSTRRSTSVKSNDTSTMTLPFDLNVCSKEETSENGDES